MRILCPLLLATAAFAGDPAADDFTHDLFARLAAREGNLVFSPLSIRVALAMACEGARGQTAEEMARVLRYDAETRKLLTAMAADYDGRRRDHVQMPALADALWAQSGVPLLPDYLNGVGKEYHASLEALDFKNADAACRRINGWVAERTNNRIREIVDPSMFNDNTTLVLANAVHFKAGWQEPFRKRATRDDSFTLGSGETVMVPFMMQTEHLGHAEKDGATAVEIPYEGRRFSMIVVLPAAGARSVVPEGLVDALRGRSVSLALPRFTFETGFRLDDVLEAMGMKTAFGPDADFSGMNGTKDLYLAVVAHKAFVAVDEEGTEAAAATAAAAEIKGERATPVVFRADRPFLFLIRDRENGAVLFLGRVSDPR